MSPPSTVPSPVPPSGRDALSVLHSVFGLPGFRGAQGEIVRHVADGGNCLVLMPTGGGKSLCYQLPSLLREGCGIVVSPLIALMRDQVAGLLEAGVNAAALNSSLTYQEASDIERRLIAGDLDLLYVAPERLTPGTIARHCRKPIPITSGSGMSATPTTVLFGASRSTTTIASPPTINAIATTSALPSNASICLWIASPITAAGTNATSTLRTNSSDLGSRFTTPIPTAQKVRQYSATIARIAPS